MKGFAFWGRCDSKKKRIVPLPHGSASITIIQRKRMFAHKKFSIAYAGLRSVISPVFLILFMGITATFATPSTQIWIPSTDVQGFLVTHICWDEYIGAYNHGTPSATDLTGLVSNGGITIGLLPFEKVKLEAGVDYRDINGDHRTPLYFNFKLGIPEDAFFKYQPAIAVGGFDFGTTKGVTTYNVGYALIAKTLPIVGRLSVGGFKGAIGSDANAVFYTASDLTAKPDDAGLLVSWDRALTELSDKLWVAVDYQSGKSGYGALSFGASYAITPDASFILGYDLWNDNIFYKPTVTFQVDMNLPAIPDWFKKAVPAADKK
jgi:hypothetical protein